MKQQLEDGQPGHLEVMETTSTLSARRDNGELRIELAGIFDASSAERLIECLRVHRMHLDRAVIETGRISHVDPVGRSTFCGRLHELEDLCYFLVFHGKYASEISPSWTFSY